MQGSPPAARGRPKLCLSPGPWFTAGPRLLSSTWPCPCQCPQRYGVLGTRAGLPAASPRREAEQSQGPATSGASVTPTGTRVSSLPSLTCRLPSEGGGTGHKTGLELSFLELLLLSGTDLPCKLSWAQAWTRVPRRACRWELGGDCGLPTAARTAVHIVLDPCSPQASLEPSRSKQLPPQGGQGARVSSTLH